MINITRKYELVNGICLVAEKGNHMDYIERIIEVLRNEGIEIEYKGVDLDLSDYIFDSIQFISFIIDIENEFGIEIADNYLRYDVITSLHSFAKIVESCKEDVG